MLELKEIRDVLMAEARRLESVLSDSLKESREEETGYARGIRGAYYILENYYKKNEADKKKDA